MRRLPPLPMISASPFGASITSRFKDNASDTRIPVESRTSINVLIRTPVKVWVGIITSSRLISSSVKYSTLL